MAHSKRVRQVNVRVAGLAQGGIVVVTEDARRVAVAQGTQPEAGDVSHDVGAPVAQRRLAFLAVNLRMRDLASLALHCCDAGGGGGGLLRETADCG
jgi:hypothetical protein